MPAIRRRRIPLPRGRAADERRSAPWSSDWPRARRRRIAPPTDGAGSRHRRRTTDRRSRSTPAPTPHPPDARRGRDRGRRSTIRARTPGRRARGEYADGRAARRQPRGLRVVAGGRQHRPPAGSLGDGSDHLEPRELRRSRRVRARDPSRGSTSRGRDAERAHRLEDARVRASHRRVGHDHPTRDVEYRRRGAPRFSVVRRRADRRRRCCGSAPMPLRRARARNERMTAARQERMRSRSGHYEPGDSDRGASTDRWRTRENSPLWRDGDGPAGGVQRCINASIATATAAATR